jgi:hypothetical protein
MTDHLDFRVQWIAFHGEVGANPAAKAFIGRDKGLSLLQ